MGGPPAYHPSSNFWPNAISGAPSDIVGRLGGRVRDIGAMDGVSPKEEITLTIREEP